MRCFYKFIFLLFFTAQLAYAEKLTLELQNTSLPEAIRLIAKFLHISVIVSPSVGGVATINLHEASPLQAFNLLLTSHDLAKWQMGDVWLIAPRSELIKHKQEDVKWQELCDESSPLVTRVWQIKYGKAEDICNLLHGEHSSLISKRGYACVDVRTNIICISDVAPRMADLNRLIRRLDVPVKQILIEARLASVDNDCERELGIIYDVNEKPCEDKGLNPLKSFHHEVGHYSLAVAKLADGSLLDVKLAALENAGRADLISSPSLFTANQQPASIEAGEEVPYQEVSDSGGTAVTFKKAVLGLKVIPQILPGNKVLLQLQINQDRPSKRLVLGVPTISTRQIMTNVLVRAGQTIVLGGIYECNYEEGQQRIPFISDIPIIGLLFKQQKTRTNKRELLIFVTPKIIAQ